MNAPRHAVLVAAGMVGTLLTGAAAFSGASDALVQLQLGQLLYKQGQFLPAIHAFEQAVSSDDLAVRVPARSGLARAAMRVGDFVRSRREAEALKVDAPGNAFALAVHGESMWAGGLFDEAEASYRDALLVDPDEAWARNGLAVVLAARGRFTEALEHAQAAVRSDPGEAEYHHTLGNVYEDVRRYEPAAQSLANFINLLPAGARDDRAVWARAELRFLRSFGSRVPYDFQSDPNQVYVLPFEEVNEKIIVRGKVNGEEMDLVVDTGAELAVVSAQTAQRKGIDPVTYTVSAGVGSVGLRGLQLARVDRLELGALKVRNVPVIIKNPPLRDLPAPEAESVSPLTFGLSMRVDYRAKRITLARRLPPEEGDSHVVLPLWMHRLATVRGLVDGTLAASFVVDTGGQVISISTTTAQSLQHPQTGRRIGLKVYGTSGWDPDAYLMPGVSLAFDDIRFDKASVVVLNLRAPSVLLGYELGGIVGHQFLSRYRVTFDLANSELRLGRAS
ncbi:MAG: retroviral-like aspartic protease family protein [Acidobacteriota bacterium]